MQITKRSQLMAVLAQVQDFADINTDDLEMECRRTPVNYMTVASAYAAAQTLAAKAKMHKESTLARLDIETRAMLQGTGAKITEATVKAHIFSTDEYADAVLSETDADAIVGLLRNGLTALSLKKDMLVTLSANRRHELNDG